ncbi:hypothetical protein PSTG_15750 [Puccinia striiformis f. sp. tritici PST-78]|uniref:Uncharacterized protein n=1 Tax=Puccinia striiformis f. sp. tritici PST-78 TaxID=1165861 RepID=A0A0L0UV69_9BASI|nr:hypothetical protein PSTG_15750 [Puccinia striiformis f. sp. tritici PST-78]
MVVSYPGVAFSFSQELGRIELEESTSINFSFHSSSSSREIPDVKVSIGRLTSEDILCDFGAPLRTFWKEDFSKPRKAFSSLLSLDIFVPHTSELRPVALSVGPYEDTYPPRVKRALCWTA